MKETRKMSELLTLVRDEMSGSGLEKSWRLLNNRARYSGMCIAATSLCDKDSISSEEFIQVDNYIRISLPKNKWFPFRFEPTLLHPRYKWLNEEIIKLKLVGE